RVHAGQSHSYLPLRFDHRRGQKADDFLLAHQRCETAERFLNYLLSDAAGFVALLMAAHAVKNTGEDDAIGQLLGEMGVLSFFARLLKIAGGPAGLSKGRASRAVQGERRPTQTVRFLRQVSDM